MDGLLGYLQRFVLVSDVCMLSHMVMLSLNGIVVWLVVIPRKAKA